MLLTDFTVTWILLFRLTCVVFLQYPELQFKKEFALSVCMPRKVFEK